MKTKEILELDDESLDIDLQDLYAPGTKWTPEDKVAAVLSYVVTGTSKAAAKNLLKQEGIKIPDSTIRRWKTQSIWWPEVYAECKKKKQQELDGKFTAFIHTAIEEIQDRLHRGDTTVTKDGDLIKVPMKGKEIAWVLGVLFDKRQLLRGDPTSRVEKITEADRLDALEESFKKMSSEVQEWNDGAIEVIPEKKKS